MNHKFTCACAALGAAVLLSCGAYALAAGDSLVSLKYLDTAFISPALEKGEAAAEQKLQETYDRAKDQLDALRQEHLGRPAGETGSSSASLAARDFARGDKVELSAGSGALMLAGTVSVTHSGVFLDVTTGSEVTSGAQLTANHRYLAGEDTRAELTVHSGAAQMGVQGSFTFTAGGLQVFPFYDVSDTDWFCAPVDYVCQKELFSGMETNRFGPGESMNRAMLMTVLYRLAGTPEEEMKAADVRFSDVAEGAWYAPYVKWGAAQGITAGTGPDTFGPEQQVTREQIVVLLYSFASNYLGLDTSARRDLSDYQDLSQANSWSRDAFSWAVSEGIVGSSSAGALTLSPQKSANRAEVAAMLRAFAEKIS